MIRLRQGGRIGLSSFFEPARGLVGEAEAVVQAGLEPYITCIPRKGHRLEVRGHGARVVPTGLFRVAQSAQAPGAAGAGQRIANKGAAQLFSGAVKTLSNEQRGSKGTSKPRRDVRRPHDVFGEEGLGQTHCFVRRGAGELLDPSQIGLLQGLAREALEAS